MSMTNENHNAEWELGDAITIRLPVEPDPETEPDDEGDDPEAT